MLRTLLKSYNSYRFASEVQKASSKSSASSNLTFYRDGQLVNRTAITLKKQEDIESYVVKTVQNYFRTTYKQGSSFLIQESPGPALSPSTVWIPSTLLSSPCRWRKIWATPFQRKPSHLSPPSSTTSLTSSKSKPSSAKTTKTPSLDNQTTPC